MNLARSLVYVFKKAYREGPDMLVDALERKAENYHRHVDMSDGTLICLACSTRRKPVAWPCSRWSELNARRAARGKAFM